MSADRTSPDSALPSTSLAARTFAKVVPPCDAVRSMEANESEIVHS